MTNIFNRIYKNFFYSSLHFVNTIVSKYLFIPLMINYWGINIFNDWILISNLIMQLSFLEIGCKSYLSSKLGRCTKEKVIYYFSYITLINIIISFLSLLIFLFCLLYGIDELFVFNIKKKEIYFVLFFLLIGFIINIFIGSIGEVILRPLGFFHKYLKIDFVISLIINLALVLILFFNFNITLFALANSTLLSLKIYFLLKCCKNNQIIIKKIQLGIIKIKKIKIIIYNGFFFLLGNITQTINTSTFILVAATVAQNNSIALFVILRAMAHFPVNVSSIFNSAFFYEYTKDKYRSFKNDFYLLLIQIKISNYIVISLIFLLYMFSDEILKIWIKNQLQINHSIFNILLLSCAVKSIFFTLNSYLNAKNNQVQLNSFLFILSIISLPLIYIITNKFNLYGFAFFLLIYDISYLFINIYFIFKKNVKFLIEVIFEILKILLLGICVYINIIYIFLYFFFIIVDLIRYYKNTHELRW